MKKLRFSELGLSPELLKAVDRMGFEEASPVQTATIPVILSGRDLVGQSSTGSGKTAAFAIPAVEKADPKLRAVQILVLCPTRELAVQVAEETAKLALFKKGVHAVPIFGGQSYDRQFRALAAGVQVVIGTPGRVLDHLQRGTLKLDALQMLVLDEADRMLDMGFREDIERVLEQAPKSRQLLFFSATMPRQIQTLIKRFSRDPLMVKIEPHFKDAPQVEQVWFEVDRRSKIDALTRIIDLHDFRYGIIFCSTKVMVDELDEHLHARGYSVERLHGDITQAQRTRVMEKFRRRGFEFLVATDVAARGLDVDDLEVVFNFDLPNDGEDYIHRIGRTGRAGKSGRAFTFVSGRELYKLQGMMRYEKLTIRRERLPSIDQVEEARENQFFEKLRTTLDGGAYRKQDRMVDRLLDQGYASTDITSALIHMMQNETPQAALPAKAVPRPIPPAPMVDTSPPARPGPQPKVEQPRKSFAEETKPKTPRKPKAAHQRTPRPGHGSKGFVTVFFNVGRKDLVTPADLVGKIAGVTRLPASVVGAIDIHQRHALVDIAEAEVARVVAKLKGIRLKGQVLAPETGQ